VSRENESGKPQRVTFRGVGGSKSGRRLGGDEEKVWGNGRKGREKV